MKYSIITIIALMIQGEIFASVKFRSEYEVDPIAFALNGYSFHCIKVFNRLRTDLGVFGIRQPDGYSGNAGYSIQSSGAGLKINYLVNKKETVFAGVGLGYYENRIRRSNDGAEALHCIASAGMHAGYRWFLFGKSKSALKGLYLTPWASLDYNRPANSVGFEKEGYKQKRWTIFPTIHIGYRL